jgi:group I intron endonuclease
MKREKYQGIYKIAHRPSGKTYIGSSMDISIRLNSHRRLLINGKHPNPPLQGAWNKYGEDQFSFEVFEVVVAAADLNVFLIAERGRHYQYRTPSSDKLEKSPEHKAKLAAHLAKLNRSRTGVPLSEDHKAKIKARCNDPEILKKIASGAISRTGKKRGPYGQRKV